MCRNNKSIDANWLPKVLETYQKTLGHFAYKCKYIVVAADFLSLTALNFFVMSQYILVVKVDTQGFKNVFYLSIFYVAY